MCASPDERNLIAQKVSLSEQSVDTCVRAHADTLTSPSVSPRLSAAAFYNHI